MVGRKRKSAEAEEPKDSDRITLNVGGKIFVTTRVTLTRMPGTMLGAMFKEHNWANADPDGTYFFDRSPKLFEHIMDIYRSGYVKSGSELGFLGQDDEMWMRELTYWGIDYSYEEQKAGDVCIGQELEDASTSVFQKLFEDYIEVGGYKECKEKSEKKFKWAFVKGQDVKLKNGEKIDAFKIIEDWTVSFGQYARDEHKLLTTIVKRMPHSKLLEGLSAQNWPWNDYSMCHIDPKTYDSTEILVIHFIALQKGEEEKEPKEIKKPKEKLVDLSPRDDYSKSESSSSSSSSSDDDDEKKKPNVRRVLFPADDQPTTSLNDAIRSGIEQNMKMFQDERSRVLFRARRSEENQRKKQADILFRKRDDKEDEQPPEMREK